MREGKKYKSLKKRFEGYAQKKLAMVCLDHLQWCVECHFQHLKNMQWCVESWGKMRWKREMLKENMLKSAKVGQQQATWCLLVGWLDLSHLNYLNSIISLQMNFLNFFLYQNSWFFLSINKILFHLI